MQLIKNRLEQMLADSRYDPFKDDLSKMMSDAIRIENLVLSAEYEKQTKILKMKTEEIKKLNEVVEYQNNQLMQSGVNIDSLEVKLEETEEKLQDFERVNGEVAEASKNKLELVYIVSTYDDVMDATHYVGTSRRIAESVCRENDNSTLCSYNDSVLLETTHHKYLK